MTKLNAQPMCLCRGNGRQRLPVQLPLWAHKGLAELPSPGFTPHLKLSGEDQELPAPCSAQGWC